MQILFSRNLDIFSFLTYSFPPTICCLCFRFLFGNIFIQDEKKVKCIEPIQDQIIEENSKTTLRGIQRGRKKWWGMTWQKLVKGRIRGGYVQLHPRNMIAKDLPRRMADNTRCSSYPTPHRAHFPDRLKLLGVRIVYPQGRFENTWGHYDDRCKHITADQQDILFLLSFFLLHKSW